MSDVILLFAGSVYYPHGGQKDFKGTFESIEAAKEKVEMRNQTNNSLWEWAQIIINNQPVLEFYFEDYETGLPTWSDIDLSEYEVLIDW